MIELNNVTKKIKDNIVLNNISIKFEEGKIYLLKGHNGSRKNYVIKNDLWFYQAYRRIC